MEVMIYFELIKHILFKYKLQSYYKRRKQPVYFCYQTFHLKFISTSFHLRYSELVHMREDILRDCGDVVLVDGAEKKDRKKSSKLFM